MPSATCSILIVDPHAPSREVMKLYLSSVMKERQQRELTFFEAADGREAIALLITHKEIKVMISELNLTQLGSLEMIDIVLGKWGLQVGIFIVTGVSNHLIAEVAGDLYVYGVRGIFNKLQLDYYELSRRIEKYLEISSTPPARERGFYCEHRQYEKEDGTSSTYTYIKWMDDSGKQSNLCVGDLGNERDRIYDNLPGIRSKKKEEKR
ncbi:response regulator receiver protein [Gloeothece verrucosa]|uniref:Response regulator receiver protein n=1 Tax=Gloeothece verrucosa (strain PCC 7822) TaxID=497965 RepID=E0UMM8_GLOV7|nr:response regulator receiver protein [Gloeothece verrucosa]ADN18208.1 response regulator receiver protein [Gloeothece verrucosa PCC 7822]